jgi:hypothetical protein
MSWRLPKPVKETDLVALYVTVPLFFRERLEEAAREMTERTLPPRKGKRDVLIEWAKRADPKFLKKCQDLKL